jgi:hypothetical protein
MTVSADYRESANFCIDLAQHKQRYSDGTSAAKDWSRTFGLIVKMRGVDFSKKGTGASAAAIVKIGSRLVTNSSMRGQ